MIEIFPRSLNEKTMSEKNGSSKSLYFAADFMKPFRVVGRWVGYGNKTFL